MNTPYRLSKLTLSLVIALLSITYGILFAEECPLTSAEDREKYAPDPSEKIGGPELTIINNLDYIIWLEDTYWYHPTTKQIGNYKEVPRTIIVPGTSVLTSPSCYYMYVYPGNNCTGACYWGNRDHSNNTVLKVKAREDKWEGKEIRIDIAEHRSGSLDLKPGCGVSRGDTECPKIHWEASWTGNGWTITFDPDKGETGFRPKK